MTIQPPTSIQRIADARRRGEQRAAEYLRGVRYATHGQPRAHCTTIDAQRGYDQMTSRLRSAAA